MPRGFQRLLALPTDLLRIILHYCLSDSLNPTAHQLRVVNKKIGAVLASPEFAQHCIKTYYPYLQAQPDFIANPWLLARRKLRTLFGVNQWPQIDDTGSTPSFLKSETKKAQDAYLLTHLYVVPNIALLNKFCGWKFESAFKAAVELNNIQLLLDLLNPVNIALSTCQDRVVWENALLKLDSDWQRLLESPSLLTALETWHIDSILLNYSLERLNTIVAVLTIDHPFLITLIERLLNYQRDDVQKAWEELFRPCIERSLSNKEYSSRSLDSVYLQVLQTGSLKMQETFFQKYRDRLANNEYIIEHCIWNFLRYTDEYLELHNFQPKNQQRMVQIVLADYREPKFINTLGFKLLYWAIKNKAHSLLTIFLENFAMSQIVGRNNILVMIHVLLCASPEIQSKFLASEKWLCCLLSTHFPLFIESCKTWLKIGAFDLGPYFKGQERTTPPAGRILLEKFADKLSSEQKLTLLKECCLQDEIVDILLSKFPDEFSYYTLLRYLGPKDPRVQNIFSNQLYAAGVSLLTTFSRSRPIEQSNKRKADVSPETKNDKDEQDPKRQRRT